MRRSAEIQLRELRAALAAATQRAEAAEARAMSLTMENVGLTNALEAQVALREAAERGLGDWQAKCADFEADLLGWRRMVRNTSEERDMWRTSAVALERERDEARAKLAAVPDYARYYAAATENWHASGTRVLSFEEWLEQQQEAHP